MEDEKKKKKNKKKKNKQNKTGEGVAVGSGGITASLDENHLITQNHGNQDSISDVQNGDVQKENLDLDGHRANGTENVGLEERIKQLQSENDSHRQEKSDLEMKIAQLRSEKDSLFQKEAALEGRISQLLDEKIALNLKRASLEEQVELQEREKRSWVLKENSTREMIASLNDDNRKLQWQVMELEESRNNLLQENQQLKENMSSLHLQIQNLEESVASAHTETAISKHAFEHADLNSQKEVAKTLVEKLTAENEDLVEKVNVLYIERDQRSTGAGLDKRIKTSEDTSVVDLMTEPSERSSVSRESLDGVPTNDERSPEAVPINEDRISADTVEIDHTAAIPNSSGTDESGEIVQIPLDENEVRELELQAAESDRRVVVPLTDAPLIGAPFRFISFVAKYVSGADLVNKTANPGPR